MKTVKTALVVVLLFTALFISHGQDGASQNSTEEKEEKEEIRSLKEERTRTLKYGIDAAMISLIEELATEKDDQFNREVLIQARDSLNQEVGVGAFKLFAATEDRRAEEWAVEILYDEDLFSQSLIISAIRYIGEDMFPEGADAVLNLLKHEERAIASAAVSALGKSEDPRYADDLLDLLEDGDFHEELKPEVILALGELKAVEAVEVLTEIVEDPDEEKGWRWRACQALGKIGDPDSFDVLKKLFSDKDKVLRTYATEAVGYYHTDEARELLMRALRDAAWDVRRKAARQLGEGGTREAVDILIYVAEEDPELIIRKEAVSALGKIGGGEALEFLGKLGATTLTAPELWSLAVETMVKEDLGGAFDDLVKIIDDEWEKDSSYFLNHIGKLFSQTESGKLKPIFERFLDHKEITVKLYGIRGIGLNRFGSLKGRLEDLTHDEQPRVIRQNALDALEEF